MKEASRCPRRSLAKVGPSRQYWIGLLFIPLATFVLLAIALGAYRTVADAEVSRPFLLSAWMIFTLLAVVWCVIRDPQVLTWSLTSAELCRGKTHYNLVIPFCDIESIVIGLPPRLPWFFRIARLNPRSRGTYENLVTLRSTALLLRLRGGRIMPLTFLTAQYRDGAQMMREFLRLNAAKIVGPETYTEREIRKLGTTSLNRIVAV